MPDQSPLLDEPFRRLADCTRFTQILPATHEVPAPPRFTFGPMPPPVADTYYRRTRLHAIGLYTGRDIVVSDGFILSKDDEIFAAPELNIQPEHIRDALAAKGAPPLAGQAARLHGAHALITGPGYAIFGHWLADILPKLAVLTELGFDLGAIKFLLPDDAPAFAELMLSLLGIGPEQLVRFGGPHGSVLVDELLMPSFLHNGVRYTSLLGPAVRLFRSRLERVHGPLGHGGYPRKILVARSAGGRALAERLGFENACVRAGFVRVAPETMPILEQWRMFASARHIIGEYGSALHASLFSEPGTIVCGLRGSKFHPAFIQSGISEIIEQHMGYVFGRTREDPGQSFNVSLDSVRACLDAVFGGASLACGLERRARFPVGDPHALVALCDRLIQAGEWQAALPVIEGAIRASPSNAAAQTRLACILVQLELPGALDAIERAISLGDISAANFGLKGELLLAEGRDAEALESAVRAVDADTEDAGHRDLLARTLIASERYSDASVAARIATLRAPAQARFRLTLYKSLLGMGRIEEAAPFVETVCRDNPRLPGAAAALVHLRLNQNRAAEALAILLDAMNDEPVHPELRTLLTEVLPGAMRTAESEAPCVTAVIAAAGADVDAPGTKAALTERFAIDFSANGNSAAYRGAGWGGQEPNQVWAVGECSTLLLPLLDPSRDWKLEIDASGFTYPGRVAAQSLSVRLHGLELAVATLSTKRSVPVFLPQEILGGDARVVLELRHPDFAVPKELGSGNDTRALALCVRRIRIRPLAQ